MLNEIGSYVVYKFRLVKFYFFMFDDIIFYLSRKFCEIYIFL